MSGTNQILASERRRLLFYQAVMFLITFMNYAMLHATRAVWSVATKDFKDLYGFGKYIKYLNTCFLGFYGIGGFFTGQLADKYKKGKLIFVLYMCISVTVCLLGLLRYIPKEKQHDWLPAYFALKIINGSLQSPGWAINMVLMSNWFPRTGRGFLLGVWACNTSTGDIIGAQVYKYVTKDKENWNIAFFIIAALVFLFGLLSLLFLVEKPSDLGFILEEQVQNQPEKKLTGSSQNEFRDHLVQQESDLGSQISGSQRLGDNKQKNSKGCFSWCRQKLKGDDSSQRKKIRFIDAFKIPGIIEFSISMFFGKIVMSAFFYCFPTYLREQMKYSRDDAADIFSLFSAGTYPGNIIMGGVSDLLPMRSPVFEVGVLLSALFTFLIGTLSGNQNGNGSGQQQIILSSITFMLGGSLIGTSIIIAAIECDMGNFVRKTQGVEALGTFAGIIDGVASTGSILSQIIVEAMHDNYGWPAAYNTLAIFLLISSLPAVSFLRFEIKQWRQRKRERFQLSQDELEDQSLS